MALGRQSVSPSVRDCYPLCKGEREKIMSPRVGSYLPFTPASSLWFLASPGRVTDGVTNLLTYLRISSGDWHCLPGHLANHEVLVLVFPAPSWEPRHSSRKQKEELAVGLSCRPLQSKRGGNSGESGAMMTTRARALLCGLVFIPYLL